MVINNLKAMKKLLYLLLFFATIALMGCSKTCYVCKSPGADKILQTYCDVTPEEAKEKTIQYYLDKAIKEGLIPEDTNFDDLRKWYPSAFNIYCEEK